MLSMPHLVVIFLVALVVLGPEKLPQVARVLGKAMAEFRRITGDFRMQIEDEMRDLERQARLREVELSQPATTPLPPPTEAIEGEPESESAVTEAPAPEEGALPVASTTPAPSQKPTDGKSQSA
jgi:Tat protein translocase TatB subunit